MVERWVGGKRKKRRERERVWEGGKGKGEEMTVGMEVNKWSFFSSATSFTPRSPPKTRAHSAYFTKHRVFAHGLIKAKSTAAEVANVNSVMLIFDEMKVEPRQDRILACENERGSSGVTR